MGNGYLLPPLDYVGEGREVSTNVTLSAVVKCHDEIARSPGTCPFWSLCGLCKTVHDPLPTRRRLAPQRLDAAVQCRSNAGPNTPLSNHVAFPSQMEIKTSHKVA